MAQSPTTAEIKLALQKKFPAPEYAVFLEVSNGTGGKLTNYADALVFGLYPSRGLERQGFEIKVSRADWLKELKNPAKAEKIAQYCDRWWVLTAPGIVEPGEIPPRWGHMEFNGKQFRIKVPAPALTPIEPTREFLAAVMRRAGERDQEMAKLAMAAELEELVESRTSEYQHDRRMAVDELARLKSRLEDIRQTTGIDLNTWRPQASVVNQLRIAEQLAQVDVGWSMARLVESLDVLKAQCEQIKSEFPYVVNPECPQPKQRIQKRDIR